MIGLGHPNLITSTYLLALLVELVEIMDGLALLRREPREGLGLGRVAAARAQGLEQRLAADGAQLRAVRQQRADGHRLARQVRRQA